MSQLTKDSLFGLEPLPPQDETIRLLKKLKKDLKVNQAELALRAGIPPSQVSRSIGKSKRPRGVTYEELRAYIEVVLDRYWSFPKGKRIRDYSILGDDLVRVFADQRVKEAATLMRKDSFNQLAVLERKTGKPLGIITSGTILERMLLPRVEFGQRGFEWFETFGSKTIDAADVVEQVPILDGNDTLDSAARNLLYRYAVLVQDRDKLGIITRDDFLKLVLESRD